MRVLKATTLSLLVAASATFHAGANAPDDDGAIVHALGRLGFGARPGDVERVRAMGLDKYIERQLEPSKIDDSRVAERLAQFQTLALSNSEIVSKYYTPPQQQNRAQNRPPQPPPPPTEPGQMAVPAEMRQLRNQANLPIIELSQQKLLRAIYSDRQLEEVLVDFWFNHFNVFQGKGQFARFYLTEYEREAIRPHVLGKFRDMLGATAKSPAMLWYLDNWMSAAPDTDVQMAAARRARGGGRPGMQQPAQPQRPPRGLNENYGRELLELHTLGVDGGYTQQDVVEVARAFTGWTIEAPRRGGGNFLFNPRMHDNGAKTVLGTPIPAGGGQRDGERVLDMLAAHPSTARHIARKLATRFVSDTPSQALVDRAAKVFLDTGGDLKHVTRAIVTSPEFMAAEARGVKVKTPLEFAVSAIRASGAEVRNAAPLVQQLRTLGMPLYGAQPPTGYDDTAASWINSGALIARMNFAAALAANRLPGTRVPAADPEPLARRLGSPQFQKR
ncbi:MAG TPA: DUF1800 domain-containing protein [Vicinamibacterales bacterium]|nr:DUF1800 domain-containing protein [Vicinamibacterales bacterium]